MAGTDTPRRRHRRRGARGVDTTPRVMDALRRLVRALSASARSSAKQGAATGAQVFLLRQIAAVPGLSVGDLAARTLAGQSTVSEVVARLVRRGLITRSASRADARQTILALTALGRRAISRVESTAQERLIEGLEALPAERRAALADALERWLDAAGLSAVPATMFFENGRGRSGGAPVGTRRRTQRKADVGG